MKKIYLLLFGFAIGMNALAQTDATYKIKNPSFENGTDGWTNSSLQSQTNNSFTKKEGSVYMEKWTSKGNKVGSASIKQTVQNLPKGEYRLTVSAQNIQQDNDAAQTGAYIYAVKTTTKTTVTAADDYTVDFTLDANSAPIGFTAASASGNWICVDNFRLTFLSTTAEQVTELIDEAKSEMSRGDNKLDELNNAISECESAIAAGGDLTAAALTLTDIMYDYKFANATEDGSLKAPVTNTSYVPTGSTEALVRATFSGTNLMEKGVCWSTEHNPTLADNRTTKSFTQNGTIIHVKGLECATVYYLRPYVLNNNFQVAYGEEVKIVTHPKGTCSGSWDEGAPDAAANTRCRNAIQETIDYFNEWTGIKGFHLSGHYGAQTPTADCSYGGWMRIGPNAGNQAIGTVIHETGHGVGVGTSSRWADKNVHNWKWYGREANEIYSFLEGKKADPYNSEFCMVGDGTHGWGANASYDWFVNGADKDKHYELQYIGGCVLLYGLFIDGLNPTTGYTNGIPGYTFNFDESKKYYIMNKDAERGLSDGFIYQRGTSNVSWRPMMSANEEITDDAAWYIEYLPEKGYYMFRNAESGKYLTHAANATSVQVKTIASGKEPTNTEYFQLMPDRTDVTVNIGDKSTKTHGYWFTWNNEGNKSMGCNAYGKVLKYGTVPAVNFDYSDAATQQQWIIISEDELAEYQSQAIPSAIKSVNTTSSSDSEAVGIYTTSGAKTNTMQKGVNVVKYSNGSSKKIYKK